MDLLDSGNGKYVLAYGEKQIVSGDLKCVAKKAHQMGIDMDEFELALLQMNDHGHTRANFGINGTFIFSSE